MATLPLIPGYSFHNDVWKTRYNKPQTFAFNGGVRMETKQEQKTQKLRSFASHLVNADFDKNAPQAFSKYILSFDAYYEEQIGDLPIVTPRFRKCKVLYFLEDDTMKIFENRQKNSGLEQGTVISRHRFQKPSADNFKKGGEYYIVEDLNIGVTLDIYGRLFKLINCDAFTRNFLTEMGYKVNLPQPDPVDPFTEDRAELDTIRACRRPAFKEKKLAPFLDNHPKALRFFGTWDDSQTLFGEKRYLTLYVSLSDGTFKLVEDRPPNSGRCDTRVLLRPTMVPKKVQPIGEVGEIAEKTLLNLCGKDEHILIDDKYYTVKNPNCFTVDTHPYEGRKVEYYKDIDLDLGIYVNIYSRQIFLYDCDDFTKEYYKSKYNRELVPVPKPEILVPNNVKVVYPHEIFGNPEQTLRTCFHIKAKPLRPDLIKFHKKGRNAFEGHILSFLARIITTDPITKSREFIVQYFLEDETMLIMATDNKVNNSSITETRHLRRMRVAKPSPELGNCQPCYYTPFDMYVGNMIYVRGNAYLLCEADEYSLDYMERNCHEFVHSNIKAIMNQFKSWLITKCGSLKSSFQAVDTGNNGFVDYENFKDIIYKEIPQKIPEQEMKTVARYYADVDDIGLQTNDMISKVQTELLRKKFDDFDKLHMTFQLYDKNKTGYFTVDELYGILRSFPVPLSRDLLKCFIYKFPSENGLLSYQNVFMSMDYFNHPVKLQTPDPSALRINWSGTEARKTLKRIKYNLFLNDLVYGIESNQSGDCIK